MSKLTDEAKAYAKAMVDGEIPVNKARVAMAKRFLSDIENPDYIINERNVSFCIDFIEHTFAHIKGPARGELFKLEDWQRFIIFNLIGFELREQPGKRRFQEAFIFIPRKNAKTFFASALAWALAVMESKNYSTVYIIATKLDRAREAFDNILENAKKALPKSQRRILDNNSEHSITANLNNGKMKIQALAADAKRADGLNSNIFILDEIHGYKSANDYFVYKQAMKAYENKLLIGITTAGDNINSFCHDRLEYCREVVEGTITDEQYFVFIAEADNPKDYLNPYQHQIANPNYNITIYPEDIMNEATQAQFDPAGRSLFLNKSLNIYVNSLEAYFNVDEFRESDARYNWTLEELSELPINWYGGAYLAKMHDLTAVALHGSYQGVDISITHAFMPRTQALLKVEESNIPVFGWEEDGLITLQNTPTTHYDEVVGWFKKMRDMGFKIRKTGFDPRFGREFVKEMKASKFKVEAVPQVKAVKSQGLRHIERQVKEGMFYCLHSSLYFYCVGNVKGYEDSDDVIRYSKISDKSKIDAFDADVMAAFTMIETDMKTDSTRRWLNEDK